MLYRLFKYNAQTSTYLRVEPDVEVKGTFAVAALYWAKYYYRGGESELAFIVARFGSNAIQEQRCVTIQRKLPEPPPWAVVSGSAIPKFPDDQEL